MKNHYVGDWNSPKKIFCKYALRESVGLCIEVFVPRKNTELHYKLGRWNDDYEVYDCRTSADGRKWIVTIIVDFTALSRGTYNGGAYITDMIVDKVVLEAITIVKTN